MDCCLLNDIPDSEGYQNSFSLVRIDSKKKNIISCVTPQDKIYWMNEINKLIDSFLEKAKNKSRISIRVSSDKLN